MPHATDEEGKEDVPTGSTWSIIATWWRRFHFSGRVIACSVLLGLGLILIGGLIFAINITDTSDKPNEQDGSLPTKAPSNFTGPVVMGIGGFIVVTGVIMCLFETQVCRKRTGDASPLISDKTGDPERRGSDPEPGPSTSHGHKSRRHGAHKTGTSPRKSKSRHVKSRSKERNQKTQSPPVPIQSPKTFITSSEDNFLTPPNTLDENATTIKERGPENSEVKHSSLMKSFTSSDPSWNQSTEFLTPSASFKDTSVSLNNSVEIDKNGDLKRVPSTEMSEKENLSSEFMTPLTVEEDRIQQLLIRMKNEQKQMAESEKTKVGTSEFSRPLENSDLLQTQVENGKKVKEVVEKTVKENVSTNVLLPESSSAMEDINQKPSNQMGDVISDKFSQNNYETNVSERNINLVPNEAVGESSDEVLDEKISSQSGLTSLINESKDVTLLPESNKGASDRLEPASDGQVDLDSSVSSDETVVSPDSFQENTTNTLSSNEISTVETIKENSDNEFKCPSSISESSDTKSPVSIDADHSNNQEKNPQQDVAEVNDLNKNDDVKIEVHGIENESKDKAS